MYSSERNVQILVALLKKNGIRKVIVSPGATNVSFVASLQCDSFFDMYSAVDERSAAYMACGMASESGEPVVLSCTGATSSRNYMPGLTEAFYRHLPILAVTSSMNFSLIGHLHPQATERDNPPKDVVRYSAFVSSVKDKDSEFDCVIKLNRAILELKHKGGGPVHINLETSYSLDFRVKELPVVRSIMRFSESDEFPRIPHGKIAIFVGAHKVWSESLTKAVDSFCHRLGAVVFCDTTSAYKGAYPFFSALYASQINKSSCLFSPDLLIHMGGMSGDYYTVSSFSPKSVWRIDEEGLVQDLFGKLDMVFEMSEISFFKRFIESSESTETSEYYKDCIFRYNMLKSKFETAIFPFSNIFVSKVLSSLIPKGSEIHLGIFNSLRSWNFCSIDESIDSFSNVGGFGIDGCLSTVLGSSLIHQDKLFFCVLGDLAFFYDMNALGNRYVGKNLRILVVNNGKGQEFRNPGHVGDVLGEDTDNYIGAARHFGSQSHKLLKHYAEDLNLTYISAADENEFRRNVPIFVSSDGSRSVLFEVFTDGNCESKALFECRNLCEERSAFEKNALVAKKIIKSIIRKNK